MAALAEKILLEAAEKDALYKPTYVEKDLDLAFDLGTLLATDPNPLDAQKLRSESREEYLTELARGNTQLLINKLFELPTERVEDVIVAKLPDGTTRLPREKPPPKPKPATRWSEFARQKGIKRRKKEKLVWDETIKDWRPRYGYKRALVEKQKNWVVEVPDGKDPYVDYVGELKEKKKERVAKNEYQRLRNIARNSKAKVPKNLFPPTENLSKDQVATAVTLAKSSTASHGKFAGTLKEEKNVRVRKAKRKFESNMGSLKKEKASQLKVLDEMARKKPKLDINQAVNHFIHDEEVKASRNKDKKTPKKLKGKQQSSKRKGGNNKARGKGRAGGKQKGGNKRNRK
ncbi:ribosome biogenesis regulatory protein homolog [Ixodes scapularis]|nr:ribosome biogenesis regulatory protein homolog [Ixodes scapularis]